MHAMTSLYAKEIIERSLVVFEGTTCNFVLLEDSNSLYFDPNLMHVNYLYVEIIGPDTPDFSTASNSYVIAI